MAHMIDIELDPRFQEITKAVQAASVFHKEPGNNSRGTHMVKLRMKADGRIVETRADTASERLYSGEATLLVPGYGEKDFSPSQRTNWELNENRVSMPVPQCKRPPSAAVALNNSIDKRERERQHEETIRQWANRLQGNPERVGGGHAVEVRLRHGKIVALGGEALVQALSNGAQPLSEAHPVVDAPAPVQFI